jgi:hypothetical protein
MRCRSCSSLLVAVAWLLALAPRAARAQVHQPVAAPGTEPAADDPGESAAERARVLLEQGVALRRRGQEAEAFQRFAAARSVAPSARATGQMGLAAKSLRRYPLAERLLLAALADAEDPWVRQNRAALQRARDLVAAQLAWVDIRTNVDRGEVRVDGQPVAMLPLLGPIRVTAGALTVDIVSEGHATAATRVVVEPGDTARLELHLERLEGSPTPAAPERWKDRARASPAAAPAPAPAKQSDDDGPAPGPWIQASAGAGAMALLAAAVGVGTGVRTRDLRDERDQACPEVQCASGRGIQLDRQMRSMAAVSTASFVVAGVAAAGSLTLWLLAPSERPGVAVAIGPGKVGARLSY